MKSAWIGHLRASVRRCPVYKGFRIPLRKCSKYTGFRPVIKRLVSEVCGDFEGAVRQVRGVGPVDDAPGTGSTGSAGCAGINIQQIGRAHV